MRRNPASHSNSAVPAEYKDLSEQNPSKIVIKNWGEPREEHVIIDVIWRALLYFEGHFESHSSDGIGFLLCKSLQAPCCKAYWQDTCKTTIPLPSYITLLNPLLVRPLETQWTTVNVAEHPFPKAIEIGNFFFFLVNGQWIKQSWRKKTSQFLASVLGLNKEDQLTQ